MAGMDEAALRADMIEGLEHQLDETLPEPVLAALQRVPREGFVSTAPYQNRSTEEDGMRALAPATVARMLSALATDEGDDVLVVGAGIGYTVAALAEIAGPRHVHAVDIDRRAVSTARSNLADAGYDAVLVDRRDGARGLPEYAPYDRILLEAGVVEPPRALREQLAPGGRLVFPQGTGVQTITAVEVGEEPDAYEVLEERGPAQLDPMLVDGEQSGIERNRTRREDAEFAQQGHFAGQGWEQDWVDWDDHL